MSVDGIEWRQLEGKRRTPGREAPSRSRRSSAAIHGTKLEHPVHRDGCGRGQVYRRVVAAVTFTDRALIDDLAESEAGLGATLGHPVAAPSGIAVVLMRPLFRFFGKRTITVDDNGITVSGRFRPWSDYGLTYETDNLVCVVLTKTTGPLGIHKRDLTEDQLAEVRRLIAENIPPPSSQTIAWIEHTRAARS
jgi:hypothetical protein